MSATHAISVVVPTRDRAHLLEACLAALSHALGPDDELIVADSASRDDSVAEVARRYSATIVRCQVPGTSRARNAGWRRAKNDVIAFIDDDVRVHPGWARAMIAAFDRFDDAGYVTGLIGPPPGESKYLVAQKIDREAVWLTERPIELQGHGANVGVRRAALADVEGFDEELGPGTVFRAAEDLDLFERLVARGYRGRYEPAASSYHESWRSTSDMFELHWSYGIGSGARIVKLARRDRSRLGSAAKATFIDHGLRPVYHTIRQRAYVSLLLRLTHMAGIVFGVLRSLPRRVVNDHFASRTRQPVSSRAEPR